MPHPTAGWFSDAFFSTIEWWCALFGINDFQNYEMVRNIIVAGLFIVAINVIAGALFGAIAGFIR